MQKIFSILAIFCLFLTACNDVQEKQQAESGLLPVTVVKAQSAIFSPKIQLSGTVVAKERISVGSALQNVQVLSVNVEVGEKVKVGQVLAYLESQNVQSQLSQNTAALNQAKANLASQQASLKEAEGTLKRYRTLMKSDSISRQELDSQQTKVSTAQSAVRAVQAEIERLQAQLADSRHQRGKATIISPVNGTMIKRNAESGTLTDSNALFEIAKDGIFELEAQATASELAHLQTGDKAVILSGNGKQTSGQIRLIFPETDASNRLGKIRIHLDQTDFLPIGAYAKVDIQLAEQTHAFTLPISAVQFYANGQANVLIVDEQGVIQRKSVEVGERERGQIAVKTGLNGTEQIVRQAGAFLNVGDRVEPQGGEK